jgi:hypothetical protein
MQLRRQDLQLPELPCHTCTVLVLMQGTVDFIIHVLSLTEERASKVDFVYPAFYGAGVTLYTTPVSKLFSRVTCIACLSWAQSKPILL